MKNFLLIFMTAVFIISCSNTKNNVSSYMINSSQTLSVIREIENIIDSVERNNIMPTNQLSTKTSREAAKIVWEKFTEQCIKKDFKSAYKIFNKHKIDFKVHLKHSSARYIFLCDIYFPFLLAFEHPDDVDKKFLEEVEMEYQLQVASIKIASEDNPYMPEYHPNTIMDYGRCLNRLGRKEEAINLATELKNSVLFLSNDKMSANYAVAWYGAHIFKDLGQIDAAVSLLLNFKQDIQTWRSEDSKYEWTTDYYDHYIELVDELIDDIKKE